MEPRGQQESPPAVIIAGFGIPGRAAAELLRSRGIAFVVIDRNPLTAERCRHTGVPILSGDVRDEQVLRAAGAERAACLILAVPDDAVCLAAIDVARRLNPALRIIARCVYTSAGLQAAARGEVDVVVAEQVVAREFTQLLALRFPDDPGRRQP